jgi:hypothetical protein
MTSGSNVHTLPAPQTRRSLRLRLKPKAPTTGYVDGGWWPRSRDLATELPGLLGVLAVRLGPLRQVAFALGAWDAAPRRAEIDGQSVRLEGLGSQDASIVHVTGTNRQRISLLLVPPEATDRAGHDAMMVAARPGNADRTATILSMSGARSDSHADSVAAARRAG